jgi:hypothetical protein
VVKREINMLCTFILEKYSFDNSILVADALDELFEPSVDYGWASAGVYCFWDPETFEILYVGLAVDLAHRFRQHNGLVPCKPSNCKRQELTEWFGRNHEIGYSVLVQSSLSQPSCKRFNLRFDLSKEAMEEQYTDLIHEGHETIVMTEGLLIAAHRIRQGKNPRWNILGGSQLGAKKATRSHSHLLGIFCGQIDDWMTARSTIIQLAQNPTYEKWEHFLHAVRMMAIMDQKSFGEAWMDAPNEGNIKEEIINSEYIPQEWIGK